MTEYDSLTPVCVFNSAVGNTREPRELSDHSILVQQSLVTEEYDELNEAYDDNSIVDVIDACSDLIVVTAGLIHKLGLNPNEVMEVVNRSNMSKFCYSEKNARLSVESYEGDERYRNVHYREVEKNFYVIYGQKMDSDGWKVLKGIDWTPAEPELQKLVDKRGNLDEKD